MTMGVTAQMQGLDAEMRRSLVPPRIFHSREWGKLWGDRVVVVVVVVVDAVVDAVVDDTAVDAAVVVDAVVDDDAVVVGWYSRCATF